MSEQQGDGEGPLIVILELPLWLAMLGTFVLAWGFADLMMALGIVGD
jgi:hypothetical protein